jgi:hypothetical protein
MIPWPVAQPTRRGPAFAVSAVIVGSGPKGETIARLARQYDDRDGTRHSEGIVAYAMALNVAMAS